MITVATIIVSKSTLVEMNVLKGAAIVKPKKLQKIMYYRFNVKFDLFQSYGLCIIFYGKISVLVSLSNVPMLSSCHNKTASPSHQPDGVLTDLLAGSAVHHGRLGGVDQV